MLQYYQVLNNAWRTEIREAATTAISLLTSIPRTQRASQAAIDSVLEIITANLGTDFAAAVSKETKLYIERSLRLGIDDVRTTARVGISIGIWGLQDQLLATQLQQQNLFWLGNHFATDISSDFRSSLTTAFQEGYTSAQLASLLQSKFADLGTKSQPYWQGLAEHTALRIREFGRLSGYEKAGARYYRLVNPMDDRTSEICRALVGENKLYELKTALEVRDNLMSIDMYASGMEDARAQIKALAPWVKESQVEYDSDGNPSGVSGAHTPFPPFHWKCRTKTEIVI